MANINTIKKFENEFLENLKNKNKKQFNLEIKGIVSFDKNNSKIDLTKLITCSENYYEDLIKVYSNDEKVIEIGKNSHIQINGSGIIYIIVNNSCDLFLDYDNYKNSNDSNFEALFVKILIKKDINLNLVTLNKGFNSMNLKIITQENSKINHYQFNFDSFTSFCECKIEDNSNYILNGLNIIKNIEFYNLNTSNHNQSNSNSNMIMNSVSLNGSKIFCDIKTHVKPEISKIDAHQKSIGLIIGKNSEISCEPILEINSQDVTCSHSASISKISEEHIYYLKSRGFSTENITEFYISEKFYSLLNKIQNEEFKIILTKKFENLN